MRLQWVPPAKHQLEMLIETGRRAEARLCPFDAPRVCPYYQPSLLDGPQPDDRRHDLALPDEFVE